MRSIKVQDELFKKIKKQRAKSIILLKNDENSKIVVKDKLELVNSKDKKIKRKVKKIVDIENVNVLNKKDKKILGYKKKEEVTVENSKKDVDKYGLIKVDFYRKMKLFTKIILGVLALILLVIIISFVSNKIKDIKSEKVAKEISEMASEKIDYMFVDINPSFAFTVKDNKLLKMACRNEDCVNIEKDLDVTGKNITDAIDYLFNFSKEKGYDTKDGVTIKTTGKIDIDTKKLDYVKIYFIQEKEKDEMLKEVINNDEIKQFDNNSYYEKLWDTLKKDSDYGKIYDCEMNDGKLSCYMKKEIFNHSNEESWANAIRVYSNFTSTVTRIFDKFGVSYELEEIIPNLVSDMDFIIENNGYKLRFNCDVDGECSTLLVNDNGTYHNRGENNQDGGEIYYFNLYKAAASLDLLNPQDILNGLSMEEEEHLDYATVKLYNFIYPDKYPMVMKDDSYLIEFMKKSLCNLNTNSCTPYEYGENKMIGTKDGEYTSYTSNSATYKVIDKKTYDTYKSFYGLEGLSYGGSELDKYNKTDYLMTIDVDPKQHYICKDYELDKETCKKITETEWDILARGYMEDGKIVIEDIAYSGDKMIRTLCNVNYETIKKTNCITQYYRFERHCDAEGCSESYEFLYEK